MQHTLPEGLGLRAGPVVEIRIIAESLFLHEPADIGSLEDRSRGIPGDRRLTVPRAVPEFSQLLIVGEGEEFPVLKVGSPWIHRFRVIRAAGRIPGWNC